MASTEAQALFNLSYLAPGQATNYYNSSNGNIGFYTFGIEAEVAINTNIKNLQLGCGGVNGADGCDVEIQNFSLGCIANSAGNCISLPANTTGTATNNPAQHTTSGSTVADTLANQQQMKDFILTNPFYQFAIKNPDNPSTREVVGLRIGAANAQGPMSFNDIISFSGYLSGIADITMQGKQRLAITRPSEWELAPTSSPPYGESGSQWPTSDGTRGTLGLAPFDINTGILGITAPARALRIQINGDVSRSWSVARSGNRFNQAMILNTDLYDVVREVVYEKVDGNNIEYKNWYLASIVDAACWLFGCSMQDVIAGLYDGLKPEITNKIAAQLASGLGVTGGTTANQYNLPGLDILYNLSNVGSLDINSPAFGITVQKENLYYPGYVEYNTTRTGQYPNGSPTTTAVAMPRGWAMYLPAAFALNISQPLDVFTANILGGAASSGNIVGLPAPVRNCWGNLTFC